MTSAAVETEVKPKTTRVRKIAIKKAVAAPVITETIQRDLINEPAKSVSYAGATPVALTPELDKVAESNHRLVQGVRLNGLTHEPHQDTKTKKRSKKLDVQGAVLAL